MDKNDDMYLDILERIEYLSLQHCCYINQDCAELVYSIYMKKKKKVIDYFWDDATLWNEIRGIIE